MPVAKNIWKRNKAFLWLWKYFRTFKKLNDIPYIYPVYFLNHGRMNQMTKLCELRITIGI